MKCILIFLVLCGILKSNNTQPGGVVQCYYSSWAALRELEVSFKPERIDPFLCTHLTYAYAELSEENYIIQPQNIALDLDFNGGLGLYGKLTSIKFHNPKLKVLLGLGGFLDSRQSKLVGSKYSKLISEPPLRRHFIEHAVNFLTGFGFDGLEIHWEFPSVGDRINLGEFIRECKTQFEFNNLVLTLNLATNPSIIGAYDVDIINRYADFVHLMTYDFHGYYEGVTNFVSPLYAHEDEHSVDKAVQTYRKLGLHPQKIVIGIATYAKSYKLLHATTNDIGSPTIGPGQPGPSTKTKGYLSYYEVCGNDWYHVHDSSGRTGAYAFKEQQWAAYNDRISIATKTRFVLKQHLLGISFWSLDQDDFAAFCGDGYFPLINAAKSELLGELLGESGGKEKEKLFSSSVDRCMTDGFYPDHLDCRKFVECTRGIVRSRSCGQPLFWNQTCQCCIPANGHCDN